MSEFIFVRLSLPKFAPLFSCVHSGVQRKLGKWNATETKEAKGKKGKEESESQMVNGKWQMVNGDNCLSFFGRHSRLMEPAT